MFNIKSKLLHCIFYIQNTGCAEFVEKKSQLLDTDKRPFLKLKSTKEDGETE